MIPTGQCSGCLFEQDPRRVTLHLFDRLEAKLNTSLDLASHAADTARRALEAWPQVEDALRPNPSLARDIGAGIQARAKALLSTTQR